jgi:hypothetical protein
MHLRLEYCLVRMFVGRPFLFSRVSSQSDPNTPEGSAGKTPTDTPNAGTATRSQKVASCRQDLVRCCIQAATEALEICTALRDSGPGLARASYIEYSSCRASLLVLIAHSIQNQSDQFRKYLRNGLDMIREMSASGDSARSEVLLIEALECALARLHFLGANQHRGEDDIPSVASLASDYESFKHWESMWKTNITVGATETASPAQGPVPAAQLRSIDRNSNSWSIGAVAGCEDDTSFAVSGNGANMNPLRPFYSAAELALFGGGGIPMSSNPSIHPETQVIEEFLALHDPTFNPGLGVGSCLGPPVSSAPGVTF